MDGSQILSRWAQRAWTILLKIDHRLFMTGCLFLVFFLGYLDFISGFEYAFSLFYLFPVILSARYLGERFSLGISAVSALTWFLSNHLAGQTYSSVWVGLENTIVRLVFFMIITILISRQQRIIEHERVMSRTDFITGITNSRAFYLLAGDEFKAALNTRRPVTLAFMDIDDFKKINDRYGHAEGDELLKVVARTMRDSLRRTDIVARMGGDEFILLLPGLDGQTSLQVLGKLRQVLIGEMSKRHRSVTFSIGAATFLDPCLPLDKAIQKVDGLMYSVKNSGKNRIVHEVID